MKKSAYQLAGVLLCLWTLHAPAQNRDLSRDLERTLASGVSEARLLEALRGYHVAFVPGFLSNVQIKPRWVSHHVFHSGQHFEDQIRWLTRNGIENHRVQLNSEAIPLQNAGTLALDLQKINKPILLITHSKGGVDVLHMLVGWPQMRSKIAGWVAIQAPFRGTPVADYVAAHRWSRDVSYPVLELVGGSRQTIGQLTTTTTTEYLTEHQNEIAAALRQVPTLCFGSHKPNTRRIDSPVPLEIFRRWMLHQGIRNDGLVPEESALLPGADFVRMDGVDHAAPSTDEQGFHYDRVKLTEALVSVLLSNGGL